MGFITWFFLSLLELTIWLFSKLGILALVLVALVIWSSLGSIGASYWWMITK